MSTAPNTIFSPTTNAELINALPLFGSGFTLASSSFQGVLPATGYFLSLALSGTLTLQAGILLTSGDGTPNRTNTSDSNGTVTLGTSNADLTAFAKAAFSGAGTTEDASVLTLQFNVTDPAVKTLRFDVAFGSDEYPEYSSTQYVDIAAVWTGTGQSAKNFALVNGDPSTPLSVIAKNLQLGNFIDNTKKALSIEYDGFINKQSIFVPVSQGLNTIRLGVADTGDSVFDSALFVFGVTSSGGGATGTFQQTLVSPNQTLDAKGGDFLFQSKLTSFANATFIDFDSKDLIFIEDTVLDNSSIMLTSGSIQVNIDADKNGAPDVSFKFDGTTSNSTLEIVKSGAGTNLALTPLNLLQDGTYVGTSGNDFIVGSAQNDKLVGLGGNDFLEGGAGFDFSEQSGSIWQVQRTKLADGSVRFADPSTGETNVYASVEQVKLDDGVIRFDFEGAAGPDTLAGVAYRIYRAAFDREPDTSGLSFWTKWLDTGKTDPFNMAGRFIDSAEFEVLYGSRTPSNGVFLTKVYENVLDRKPDQGGYDFWVSRLDNGTFTQAEVLARFSDSPENRANVAPFIQNGIVLNSVYFDI